MSESDSPFGPIALGLSGGGYRAAAFHLGALDLLWQVGLLDTVRGLSTVSGGSFTGARWAVALARGEPFETFFQAMAGFLAGTDCVAEALAIVGARRHTPSRRPSLITAAAEVYATRLVPGATFGELLSGCHQLRELTFNTTEFQSGLDFRFQKSQSASAVIGNNKYRLKASAAALVRLGDIVAASSCFPGGFEPIGFPDDFVWPGGAPPDGPSPVPNALGRIPYGLALMDGGIYDNQGLDALILAQRRAENAKTPFGLVIVSDSDQDPTLFTPAAPPPPGSAIPAWAATEVAAASFHLDPVGPPGWLSFPVLRAGILVTSVLALGSAGVLGLDLARAGGLGWVDLLRTAFPMAVMLVVAAGAWVAEWWLRSKVKGHLSLQVARLWGYLRRQKLTVAADLVTLRGGSLFALASKVFTRRIRSLGLSRLFSEPLLEGRVVTNQIHDLISAARVWTRNARYEGIAEVTPAQLACARQAHEVETLLWFQDPQHLSALVATGQGTLCFNLLVHVKGRLVSTPGDAGLLALQARLLALWDRLRVDPYCLVRGRVR
jgi:predicted acylesterase/phospholipase RssA